MNSNKYSTNNITIEIIKSILFSIYSGIAIKQIMTTRLKKENNHVNPILNPSSNLLLLHKYIDNVDKTIPTSPIRQLNMGYELTISPTIVLSNNSSNPTTNTIFFIDFSFFYTTSTPLAKTGRSGNWIST